MEYVYYAIVVITIMAVCAAATLSSKNRRSHSKQRPASNDTSHASQEYRQSLQRNLKNVPTPWGWPKHAKQGRVRRYGSIEAQEVTGASASFQHFVDRLLDSKQSRTDRAYRARGSESLRHMLEDRYGSAIEPAAIKYRKVRPPRLRNPNDPHDQMDNFPSGKTDQITSKLSNFPAKTDFVASELNQEQLDKEVSQGTA